MGYISTWKNARELGKSTQVNNEKEIQSNIELKTVEVIEEKKEDNVKDVNTVDSENAINISQLAKE